MNQYLHSIIDKLFHHSSDYPLIITADELNQFFKQAWSQSADQQQTVSAEKSLVGEKSSLYNGRGMDYSESRAYVSGDDIRHINWKQSARNAELISNQYYQENENTDYIVLDLRASMMFGTRTQNKAATAIKAAVVAAMYSLKQHKSVCIIKLQNSLIQSPLISSYQQLLEYFNAVAAKKQTRQTTLQPNFSSALRFIQALKPAYSLIAVISDCNDVTDNERSLITTISSVNQLRLYKISDPVEVKLPDICPIHYQSVSSSQSVTISNKKELRYYQDQINQFNKSISTLLESLDTPVSYLSNQLTDQELIKQTRPA
ncbi:MAG: DUF58 domain-containing protein [Gammaproteobacteria bacterium]|nr:DUF58 domain-containing protein [Gammaproteobacteria bacterium]